MLKTNIYDFKTHLSQYLSKVKEGEIVEICERNVPVAILRAIEQVDSEPRPMGLAKGLVEIKEDFFNPLPDELLNLFGQ
jgi:antitoxin (DNA-binding transcriptional repressor) of toxin-antitoxin stability system